MNWLLICNSFLVPVIVFLILRDVRRGKSISDLEINVSAVHAYLRSVNDRITELGVKRLENLPPEEPQEGFGILGGSIFGSGRRNR